MCAGREFQVEGADTEKAREEKLLVIPVKRPTIYCTRQYPSSASKLIVHLLVVV